MNRIPATLVLLCTILLGSLCAAETKHLRGKVVGVHDGDTLTLLVAKREVKIRLVGIDAPELNGQPYGQDAKQALSDRVFGREVVVEATKRDFYGRTLGAVMFDGRNINQEMIEAGYAWWFRRYAPNAVPFEQAEAEAREAKRGLWQDKNPVPPWEWRKKKPTSNTKAR